MLVLGIHDSFIIRADRHKNLQDIMEKAYISYMNLDSDTRIKTKKEKQEFSKQVYRKVDKKTKKPINSFFLQEEFNYCKKERGN